MALGSYCHIACWIFLFEQSDGGKEEEADEEISDSKGTPKGRKKIRKIIEDMNLRAETQEALREEEERCKRLADREQQMEDRREVLHAKQKHAKIKISLFSSFMLRFLLLIFS